MLIREGSEKMLIREGSEKMRKLIASQTSSAKPSGFGNKIN
jgi:hypothetical protein